MTKKTEEKKTVAAPAPMPLYEVASEMRMILDDVFSGVAEENWEERFDALELALEKKCLSIRHVIREMEGASAVLKSECQRLTDRKRVMDNAVKRLKEYTIGQLDAAGRDEVKVDGIGMKICKTPPKVFIDDVDLIRRTNWRLVKRDVTYTPIADEIKKWAAEHNGNAPEGARIESGRRLRID